MPVPVDLGPRQTQTDPSVCNPCIAFGAGGQAQELVQVSWPPLPFSSLRTAGFAVPQGIVLCDRVDRDGSPAAVRGAPAMTVRHEQPQEPLEVVVLLRLRLLLLTLCFRSRRCSRGLVCALIRSLCIFLLVSFFAFSLHVSSHF